MTNPASSIAPNANSLRCWLIAAMMMGMIAIIAVERWHTMDEPLGRDVAGFAVLSHEMLAGRKLYSDLWERKPPLLFISYAVAERLTSYGPHELFLLNMIASVGSLIAIYFAGGIFAAGLWTLLCGDIWVIGNQPTAEIFVSLFLVSGFALMLRKSSLHPPWHSLIVGLLFAAATLFKHHVIVVIAVLLLVDAVRKTPLKPGISQAAIVAGVIATVWALVFFYFLAEGTFADFYSALFRQNAAYAGNLFLNVGESLRPSNIFRQSMLWSLTPLSLVMLWIVTGAKNRAATAWPMVLAYAASAWVVVALPGYFWGHYYQVLVPSFCIAGGWATTAILKGDSHGPALVRLSGVAIIFALTACWQAACYRLSPEQLAREQYVDDLPEERALGEQLNRTLLPQEHFWELGEENEIYFASRKSPPVGLLYLEPLEFGPERQAYADRLLADLSRAKPDLIIVDLRWTKALPANAGILPWVQQNYLPDHGQFSRYTYRAFVRRGSELEKRLTVVP